MRRSFARSVNQGQNPRNGAVGAFYAEERSLLRDLADVSSIGILTILLYGLYATK
jgi:hypothetical protein